MEPVFHLIAGGPEPVSAYSHVVETEGWLFVTGQLSTGLHDSHAPLPEGIEAQTRKVLENLRAVLAGVGADLSDAVMVRIFLTDFERDYEAMNAVYREFFAPGKLPARTTVGVTHLARGGLVEIDMIARRK